MILYFYICNFRAKIVPYTVVPGPNTSYDEMAHTREKSFKPEMAKSVQARYDAILHE